MWRCTVCSYSNEDSTNQCGRCQIEKNPDHHEIRGEYEEDATLLTGQVMTGMQAIIQTSHMPVKK